MAKLFILFLFIFTSPIISKAESIEPMRVNVITTRFGTVTTRWMNETPLSDIKVNGKVIYKSDIGGFNFYRVFKLNYSDVILLGENCVCSNQDSDHFYFLLLRPNKKPELLTNNDFHSSDFTLDSKQTTDKIVIDLGFENGKHKYAELISGKLIVHLDKTDATMHLDDCEELYVESSTNCVTPKECQYADPSDASASGMTKIRVLSQQPGYNPAAMDSICRMECETAKPISYERFKAEVCGIK